MSIDLGDVVPLAVQIRDGAGSPADAGAVTCTVTTPDGASAAVPVARTAPGLYTAVYATTQAGPHGVRWVATGTNASAFSDGFTVAAPSVPLVSLADAKARLNIASSQSDEELRRIIATASGRAAAYCGRVLAPRVLAQTIDATMSPAVRIVLPTPALISVTTVTQDGVAVTGWEMTDSGQVLRRTGGLLWSGVVSVTGMAGVTGDDLAIAQQAALELTAHLWTTQRTPMGRNADPGPVPGQGYALPNRVTEMLDPLILSGLS